jgi:hypothetical protein
MKMDENNAIRALQEVKEVLDQNKIVFWLDCGTLLGAVRENRIIPWDDDVDLAIMKGSLKKNTLKKKLARELEKKGFIVHFFWDVVNITRDKICVTLHYYHNLNENQVILKRVQGKNKVGAMLTQLRRLSSVSYYGGFVSKSSEGKRFDTKTNLFRFFHYVPLGLRERVFRVFDVFLKPYQKTVFLFLKIPKDIIGNMKVARYYDKSYRIPGQPEKYLEKHYGDWKTPPEKPEEWDWTACGEWVKVKR